MEDKERKVPKLRFPGFTGDWEQRKLGDIVDIVGGGTPATGESLYWNGDIDWYSPSEIYDDTIYIEGSLRKITLDGLNNSSAKILPAYKTILFTSRATIGEMAILSKAGCTNQGFQSFIVNEGKIEIYFLFSMKPFIKKYAIKHASGSTFLEVSKNVLQNMPLFIPCEEEQKLIAKIFSNMDISITLHQRKLDDTKKLKNALLQKMFPKEGSNVPELRFPGCTGAWEQRKLGDIVDIVGGGTPATGESLYWNGDIDWYSPSEIYDDTIYIEGSLRKITLDGLNNSSAKILPAYKTILFTSRATIGEMAILSKAGCTNQGFQSFIVNEGKIEIYFLFSMKPFIKKYAIKHASGSTFLEVSKNVLQNMPLFIPCEEEQKLIAKIFSNMDISITLHQRKLDNMKKLKQSLLQQMFV